jgi:hypothetical protein
MQTDRKVRQFELSYFGQVTRIFVRDTSPAQSPEPTSGELSERVSISISAQLSGWEFKLRSFWIAAFFPGHDSTLLSPWLSSDSDMPLTKLTFEEYSFGNLLQESVGPSLCLSSELRDVARSESVAQERSLARSLGANGAGKKISGFSWLAPPSVWSLLYISSRQFNVSTWCTSTADLWNLNTAFHFDEDPNPGQDHSHWK